MFVRLLACVLFLGGLAAYAEDRGPSPGSAVSLFDDPETWPVVSDVTYGRVHPAELELRPGSETLWAGIVSQLEAEGVQSWAVAVA